jgi:hypothetical protein
MKEKLPRWVYVLAVIVTIAAFWGRQDGTPTQAGSGSEWGSGERWASPAEEPCRQAVRAKAPDIGHIEWTQAVTFRNDKAGPVLKIRLAGTGTFAVQPYANRDPQNVPIQLRCDYFPATAKACLVDRTEGECEAAAG